MRKRYQRWTILILSIAILMTGPTMITPAMNMVEITEIDPSTGKVRENVTESFKDIAKLELLFNHLESWSGLWVLNHEGEELKKLTKAMKTEIAGFDYGDYYGGVWKGEHHVKIYKKQIISQGRELFGNKVDVTRIKAYEPEKSLETQLLTTKNGYIQALKYEWGDLEPVMLIDSIYKVGKKYQVSCIHYTEGNDRSISINEAVGYSTITVVPSETSRFGYIVKNISLKTEK